MLMFFNSAIFELTLNILLGKEKNMAKRNAREENEISKNNETREAWMAISDDHKYHSTENTTVDDNDDYHYEENSDDRLG